MCSRFRACRILSLTAAYCAVLASFSAAQSGPFQCDIERGTWSPPGTMQTYDVAISRERIGEQATAPYPPSPIIASIEWAPLETVVRHAKGSDNFPLTWSDDGALYTTYGDGFGFEPFVPKKLSLGLARIRGSPDNFSGVNVRSPSIEQYGDGRSGRKGWGILSVDGTLYLWMGHADQNGGQSQLAWSEDHGQSWHHADWRFTEFGLIGFVNFGKDYAGARDEFVYAYSHDGAKADTPADRFILMRAPKEQLTRRADWEFFVRRDGQGGAVWSHDMEKRGAVFEHPDFCLRSAITYNAPLGRYLWWQAIPQPPGHRDRGDTRFDGGFGVYDAPEPWGPWTTVFFTRQWDTGPGEHGDFPSKWMSADGLTVHLVFSGDDQFCVRRAQLAKVPRSLRSVFPVPDPAADAEIRYRSALILYYLGSAAKPATTQLAEAAESDDHEHVRRVAVNALGVIGAEPEQILGPIRNALKDPSAAVRRAAMTALSGLEIDPAAIVPDLASLLADTNAGVRTDAAQLLSRLGRKAEPATRHLIGALDDEDQNVARYAAMALGKIKPTAATVVPALQRKPEDGASESQAAFLWALREIQRQ